MGVGGYRFRQGLAFSAAASLLSQGTVAQQLPNVRAPSSEEINRKAPVGTAPRANVTVRTRGTITAGPCPSQLLESPLTVPLSSVDFVGTKNADGQRRELPSGITAALMGIGQPVKGTTQPIRIVCDLRDAANAALTDAGYVAQVQVPQQTVEGRLVFEVVTARITELRVRGDPGPSRARIGALLDRLQALEPFKKADAERILLLAADIPGVSVTLELSPAPNGQQGDLIGDITVEHSVGTLLLNAQNFGSEQIGPFGGLVRGELYGLTGMADRTFVSVFSTSDFKEQQVLQLGHDFALGSHGLRFGGQFTYAWTHPTLDAVGGTVDLRSRALLATIDASYPLIRSLDGNLSISGGFGLINQRVTTSGTLINLDKLRILFVQLNGDSAQRPTPGLAPTWRVGFDLEARKGINVFDATKQGGNGTVIPTRFEGDPEAFVVRGDVQTELRARIGKADPKVGKPVWAATLATEFRGQWANHPLLSFEEQAVGNLSIGRGYDPGATSGDRAAGVIVEARLGKPQPLSRRDTSYEVFGFYDAVRIWNLDTGSTETNRTLASVGGGIRLAWGDHARLDVTYAHPLDKALSTDSRRSPDRVLFSLVIRAFPWRN